MRWDVMCHPMMFDDVVETSGLGFMPGLPCQAGAGLPVLSISGSEADLIGASERRVPTKPRMSEPAYTLSTTSSSGDWEHGGSE